MLNTIPYMGMNIQYTSIEILYYFMLNVFTVKTHEILFVKLNEHRLDIPQLIFDKT